MRGQANRDRDRGHRPGPGGGDALACSEGGPLKVGLLRICYAVTAPNCNRNSGGKLRHERKGKGSHNFWEVGTFNIGVPIDGDYERGISFNDDARWRKSSARSARQG